MEYCQYGFEKLQDDNYTRWAYAVRQQLESRELWAIVSGNENEPHPRTGVWSGLGGNHDAYKMEWARWYDKRQEAFRILTETVTNKYQGYIGSADTPWQAWIRLQEASTPSPLSLFRKLKKLEKQPKMSISQHEREYEAIIDTLDRAGRGFSEEDKVINYLLTLPDDYKACILYLEPNLHNVSFHSVKRKVREEEIKLNAERPFKPTNNPEDESFKPGVVRRASSALSDTIKTAISESLKAAFKSHRRAHEDSTVKKQNDGRPKPEQTEGQKRPGKKSHGPVQTAKDTDGAEKPPGEVQTSGRRKIDYRGGIYTGQLDEISVPHGEGEWIVADQSRYVGSWRNGFEDGKGVLNKVGYCYEGWWCQGEKHGWGKEIVRKDGIDHVYEIKFERGKRHGTGTKDGFKVHYEQGVRKDCVIM